MKNLKPKELLFVQKLERHLQEKKISEKYYHIFLSFFESFREALAKDSTRYVDKFSVLLELIIENIHHPYPFPLFHQKIRAPFDYYTFGKDFFLPLIDKKKSQVCGTDHIKQVESQIKKKENVILFANHQIEGDPQAISLLFDDACPFLADRVISVAGERVTTDPFAIPFSLGCDLLCIYSKKYIDNPPEHRHYKQMHNKKTMEMMRDLLREGGKLIYVAPSGGRDRPDSQGKIIPALFDPRSIEMFYLMAKRAKTPTHFYPLALSTYDLMPPPETTEIEVGEKRSIKKTPISLALGPEIAMESFDTFKDKTEKREKRGQAIYNMMLYEYQKIYST